MKYREEAQKQQVKKEFEQFLKSKMTNLNSVCKATGTSYMKIYQQLNGKTIVLNSDCIKPIVQILGGKVIETEAEFKII